MLLFSWEDALGHATDDRLWGRSRETRIQIYQTTTSQTTEEVFNEKKFFLFHWNSRSKLLMYGTKGMQSSGQSHIELEVQLN